MSKRLVVNYASGNYLVGQRKLLASLEKHHVPHYLIYEKISGESGDYTPHSKISHYFKAELMQRASKMAESVIWLDASVTVEGPLDPLFEIVELQGYLLFDNGWNNGQWCNDRSLSAFGFTRDEALAQPQIFGATFGLSSTHPEGQSILRQFIQHCDLFNGRPDNRDRTESEDPRCLGHRHDQSVLSLIAAERKCTLTLMKGWTYYCPVPPRHLITVDKHFQ